MRVLAVSVNVSWRGKVDYVYLVLSCGGYTESEPWAAVFATLELAQNSCAPGEALKWEEVLPGELWETRLWHVRKMPVWA